MPIAGQAQGNSWWRRLSHADLHEGAKTDQPCQNFVAIRMGLGIAGFCEVIDTSEVVTRFTNYVSDKELGKGQAVAQGWHAESLVMQSFRRVHSNTQTICLTLPCFLVGEILQEEPFKVRVREHVAEIWCDRQHQNLEYLHEMAQSPDPNVLCILLDWRDAPATFEQGLSGFVRETGLDEPSVVPVVLAEPEAISAMLLAQEEEESRAQAEIDESRVSRRLIRDDPDEL